MTAKLKRGLDFVHIALLIWVMFYEILLHFVTMLYHRINNRLDEWEFEQDFRVLC